jgi:hypothetical protein
MTGAPKLRQRQHCTPKHTVRQTEVEVEDERGNTISGTGTTDRT